jgi:hypothetical protein
MLIISLAVVVVAVVWQTPSHVSNRFLGHGASVHKTAG